jgi:hypothetical protein
MRQGFKQGHATNTIILGMSTDFRDTTGEEIRPGTSSTESMMPGEGKRILRLMGR